MLFYQFKYLNYDLLNQIASFPSREDRILFVQKLSDDFAVNNYEPWESMDDPFGKGRNSPKYRAYESGEQYRYRKELMYAVDCDVANKKFYCWAEYDCNCVKSTSYEVDKNGEIVLVQDIRFQIHHFNYKRLPVKYKVDQDRKFVIREKISEDIKLVCRFCHLKFNDEKNNPNLKKEKVMSEEKSVVKENANTVKENAVGKKIKRDRVTQNPIDKDKARSDIQKNIKDFTSWAMLVKIFQSKNKDSFKKAFELLGMYHFDENKKKLLEDLFEGFRNIDLNSKQFSPVIFSDKVLNLIRDEDFSKLRTNCGVVTKSEDRKDVLISTKTLINSIKDSSSFEESLNEIKKVLSNEISKSSEDLRNFTITIEGKNPIKLESKGTIEEIKKLIKTVNN